jgi:GTPase SAR1 family protein
MLLIRFIIVVQKVRIMDLIPIGAVVVYDCTDPDTFKKMNQWVSELKQYLPQEIPIMIAGNKSDIANKAVGDEQAHAYAR